MADQVAGIYNFRWWWSPLHYYLIPANYAVSDENDADLSHAYALRAILLTIWTCRRCVDILLMKCRRKRRYSSTSIVYGILICVCTRGSFGLAKRPWRIWSILCSNNMIRGVCLVYDSKIDRWSVDGFKLALCWLIYRCVLLTASQTHQNLQFGENYGQMFIVSFSLNVWCNCEIAGWLVSLQRDADSVSD